MLQIAVCDDDSRMVSIYERAVREGLKQCGCTGTIKLYEDGRNLLCDITDDGFYFDLLLLDIEMPGVTGMELAERIRPFLPDVKIIFVTSHIEYAIDAFELSVFRY
ncbi:MAG: LytR/AlgR family response regulator transcription factor, partial [Candidatus Merdisoma sp.]